MQQHKWPLQIVNPSRSLAWNPPMAAHHNWNKNSKSLNGPQDPTCPGQSPHTLSAPPCVSWDTAGTCPPQGPLHPPFPSEGPLTAQTAAWLTSCTSLKSVIKSDLLMWLSLTTTSQLAASPFTHLPRTPHFQIIPRLVCFPLLNCKLPEEEFLFCSSLFLQHQKQYLACTCCSVNNCINE